MVLIAGGMSSRRSSPVLWFLGLWGEETRSPSGSWCLFSPFHWARVLCQHLLSAGPHLLTPVAQPAILLILFYLVCMTVVPTWMSVLLV